MRLLLDTHVALWWLNGDPALSDELVDILAHEPQVYLSPVTVWEIAIKQAIGKLEGPPDLPEQLQRSGFIELPVEHRHALAAGRLPMIHRDPFDRMLLAQAQCEGLQLATRDPWCHKYDVDTLPV